MFVKDSSFKYLKVLLIILSSNSNLIFGRAMQFDSIKHKNMIYLKNNLNDRLTLSRDVKENIVSYIKIKVYTGTSINNVTIVDIAVDQSKEVCQQTNPLKPLVIYFHGYFESPSSESVKTIVEAYLTHGKENIFLLDWSDLAFGTYNDVARNAENVATLFAKTLDQLFELCVDLEKLHLVGHSLGAHIAGNVGIISNYSIPRITGLDPTNPLFAPTSHYITTKSAQYVDIIHTDAGGYGVPKDTGTVDFYANKGTRPQPGCQLVDTQLSSSDLYSHWRSWRIYAESLKNPYVFPATKCSSYREFESRQCQNNNISYAGYAADNTAYGSYYFITNASPPYGKE